METTNLKVQSSLHSATNDSGSLKNTHAAFTDNFSLICTILSCSIAGFQIMQHLRYYSSPQI